MYKTILFVVFLLSTQYIFSQSHEIEELFIELSGNATNGDFSNNTYYVAFDSCDVSWQIIRDSIPSGWEFSFCFPNCYDPGVTSGNSLFLDNSETFVSILNFGWVETARFKKVSVNVLAVWKIISLEIKSGY